MTTQKATHVQAEWIVVPEKLHNGQHIAGRSAFICRNGRIICKMDRVGQKPRDPESEANAAFIVRACNAHDDLLAACKAALADRFGADDPCVDADPITDQLRAALAKAEGGAA